MMEEQGRRGWSRLTSDVSARVDGLEVRIGENQAFPTRSIELPPVFSVTFCALGAAWRRYVEAGSMAAAIEIVDAQWPLAPWVLEFVERTD